MCCHVWCLKSSNFFLLNMLTLVLGVDFWEVQFFWSNKLRLIWVVGWLSEWPLRAAERKLAVQCNDCGCSGTLPPPSLKDIKESWTPNQMKLTSMHRAVNRSMVLPGIFVLSIYFLYRISLFHLNLKLLGLLRFFKFFAWRSLSASTQTMSHCWSMTLLFLSSIAKLCRIGSHNNMFDVKLIKD